MVHDRYHVTDPVCGLVRSYSRKADALDRAEGHPCEEVKVHDVMARRGSWWLWDAAGNPLERRPEQDPIS